MTEHSTYNPCMIKCICTCNVLLCGTPQTGLKKYVWMIWDALLWANGNIRETRFFIKCIAFRWSLVGTEETWAIYRDVQLIPQPSSIGSADNADIIADASQVERCQLNSRCHLSSARATTYIPKQLKPIKTAAAGNWPANSTTECDGSRGTFFPRCVPPRSERLPFLFDVLSRQTKAILTWHL